MNNDNNNDKNMVTLPFRKINLMKIEPLIDRDYPSVSIMEDIFEIAVWLRDNDYFAVIDEDLEAIGIITLKDVNDQPTGQVIDCDFIKPMATPNQTIFEVFEIMKAFKTYFLPVYERNEFVGVISLMSITEKLISTSLK